MIPPSRTPTVPHYKVARRSAVVANILQRSTRVLSLACPAAVLLEQGVRCWRVSLLPTELTTSSEIPQSNIPIATTKHLIQYFVRDVLFATDTILDIG